MIQFALQQAEVDFIHDVRALTEIQRDLLFSMARKLSHDLTPVVILADTKNVHVLFPTAPQVPQPPDPEQSCG